MSFCSFSSELILGNTTSVDNIFLNEYLPYAPDMCVKVYLYGLYKCNSAHSYDNTIKSFSDVLGISEQDVENCFLYWQDQGLVKVLSTNPIEVKYIPIKNAVNGLRKYNKDKYSAFNSQIQEILNGKMITPNEYAEYYSLLESYHIEPEALIMVAGYCAKLKGNNVGYHYILTVAKNWAMEGVTTCEKVEEKLKSYEQASNEIGDLMKIMQIKRLATLEEHELFNKWIKNLDFNIETIKHIAKITKSGSKLLSFDKLDNKICSYYEKKLFSIKEIDEFEQNKTALFDTAKNVCKAIGVYYDVLETVVDNYITTWNALGFDNDTLTKIANYAFKNSIRTLDGVNTIVQKFFKLGIVSNDAIDEYAQNLLAYDDEIKQLLSKIGIVRNVNNFDREQYKTWTKNWNMNNELIDYAISLSAGKSQPMQYMNKILSIWHDENIKTKQQAEKHLPVANEKTKQNFKQKEYDKGELNALFQSLDEVEI